MIDAPEIRVHLSEEQQNWEWALDSSEARDNALLLISKTIFLGLGAFVIVVALRNAHILGSILSHRIPWPL